MLDNDPSMGGMSNYEVPQPMAGGGVVPRQTEISGQPHMLAYINSQEENLLRGLGGSGQPGPGGVPAYVPYNPGGSSSDDPFGTDDLLDDLGIDDFNRDRLSVKVVMIHLVNLTMITVMFLTGTLILMI